MAAKKGYKYIWPMYKTRNIYKIKKNQSITLE